MIKKYCQIVEQYFTDSQSSKNAAYKPFSDILLIIGASPMNASYTMLKLFFFCSLLGIMRHIIPTL